MMLMPGIKLDIAFLCISELAEAGGFENIDKLFFEVNLEAFALGVLLSALYSWRGSLYLRGYVPKNSSVFIFFSND
jgi:hypothetical protein